MRVLSVGDIHTKVWFIDSVREIVDKYDHIVFCGDFADDWSCLPSDSIRSWSYIKQLVDDFPNKVHAIIGNHDFAYIHREIAGRSSGWDPITYHNINLPENNTLKRWFLSLPITLELDNVVFSHAGITETWSGGSGVFNLWCDDSPIWARPEMVQYKKITQVMGHTPQTTCSEIEPNIWLIDTFSTYRDGSPIGDFTVLEIIDGLKFNVLKLEEINNENNNNIASIKD